MAKIDDDIPNFDNLDNLNVPDDESAAKPTAEPVAEPKSAEIADPEVVEIGEAGAADAAPPAEELAEMVQPVETKEEEPEERPLEKPSKLPLVLPVAVAVGLPMIALLFAVLAVTYFSAKAIPAISMAVYVIALGYIPLGLWLGRKTNTVYVVFLGCILAAVLTGVYCLWMHLARYNFDIKANDAKQRVGMVSPGRPHGETDAGLWKPYDVLG